MEKDEASKKFWEDERFLKIAIPVAVIAIIYFLLSAFSSFAHNHPILGTIVILFFVDILIFLYYIRDAIFGAVGIIILLATFISPIILVIFPAFALLELVGLLALMFLLENVDQKMLKDFGITLIVVDIIVGYIAYSIFK